MEEASSAMEVDAEQIEPNSATSPQPTDSPKPTPRPTPRKLPKFPIDLHMPVTVYWPESNDKIIVCSHLMIQVFCSSILLISSHLLTKSVLSHSII